MSVAKSISEDAAIAAVINLVDSYLKNHVMITSTNSRKLRTGASMLAS